MNKYLAYSGGLHVLAALFLLLLLAPSAKKPQATYTIDFIGSGKVVATTGQEASASVPKAPKAAVQAPEPVKEAPKATPKKTAKKAYSSKSEITTKKQPAKKEQPKAPSLAAPSVLDEDGKDSTDAKSSLSSSKEGEFAGGNIQTDFFKFNIPFEQFFRGIVGKKFPVTKHGNTATMFAHVIHIVGYYYYSFNETCVQGMQQVKQFFFTLWV